ncbi:MAG: hypothetical protein AAB840_01470 [Patescibacteria group bacterium]
MSDISDLTSLLILLCFVFAVMAWVLGYMAGKNNNRWAIPDFKELPIGGVYIFMVKIDNGEDYVILFGRLDGYVSNIYYLVRCSKKSTDFGMSFDMLRVGQTYKKTITGMIQC